MPNYNQINWYKQTPDQDLTFIGYKLLSSNSNKEPDFETKVDMSGDGSKKVSLTIKDLSSKDNAVYVCAAYYTVLQC